MKSSEFRANFMNELWETHLKGGVQFTEFATFMANDAEAAFESCADLAALLAACATVETYIRWEVLGESHARSTFKDLVDASDLPTNLKEDLEELRKYRNKWVHVKDAGDDDRLLRHPEIVSGEIAQFTELAMKCMVRTLCANQWV